jgi:plasmid stability protein
VGKRNVLCYSETVKNITVSLPDEVYRKARIKAAERDTSVSALVREFLTHLSEEESDFERRKRLQQEIIASIQQFNGADRLDRDAVHDRDALR